MNRGFLNQWLFRRSPVRRAGVRVFLSCLFSSAAARLRAQSLSPATPSIGNFPFDSSTLSSQRPPLITITDGVDSSFDAPTFPGDIDLLLRVEGTTSRMITIRGTNIQNPEKRISLGPSVSQQAVLIEE